MNEELYGKTVDDEKQLRHTLSIASAFFAVPPSPLASEVQQSPESVSQVKRRKVPAHVLASDKLGSLTFIVR